MSTLVAVRKNNEICIAGDSLTTFGDTRLSSGYDAAHDKIHKYGDNYIGVVGSAAHALVIQSIFDDKAAHKLDLSSRQAIFETFRALHPKLKEEYFLNPKEDEEDAYESSRMDVIIVNAAGIFGVYSLREVFEYSRFWALGSGSEFALGAMYALYDRADKAEEVARGGVEAGAEFNAASSLPMTHYTIKTDSGA
jgi:ATP-dependent protease HslVU (ClpYQ) peptidase subunit